MITAVVVSLLILIALNPLRGHPTPFRCRRPHHSRVTIAFGETAWLMTCVMSLGIVWLMWADRLYADPEYWIGTSARPKTAIGQKRRRALRSLRKRWTFLVSIRDTKPSKESSATSANSLA